MLEAAAELTADFEGFDPNPYWDVSQWSIGYGTGIGYDPKKKPGVTVTQEQGVKMLQDRLATDLDKLVNKLKKPITSNALVALLSFSYNLGIGRGFTMLDRYNSGQTLGQIAESMLKYWHVKENDPKKRARMETHLQDRRAKEVEIFLT